MQPFFKLLGIESRPASHVERLVSSLGGFIGILIVYLTSHYFLTGSGAYLMVASMGASAVLLFAVPHGALSQPWPLVGGHLVSALVGVSCAQLVPDTALAAALAVGLAVGVMHYLRCIHPPGGATALTAVIGGTPVLDLGYAFVITPVFFNALAILITAVAFNALFAWRRYPHYLNHVFKKIAAPDTVDAQQAAILEASNQDTTGHEAISHEDFVYALSEIDSYIDVTEKDLLQIYELATKHRESQHIDPRSLKLGNFYSNGKYGDDWAVRQIVDWAEENTPINRSLIYKGVAGAGRRKTGIMTVNDFSKWARHEVFRDEENWRRV